MTDQPGAPARRTLLLAGATAVASGCAVAWAVSSTRGAAGPAPRSGSGSDARTGTGAAPAPGPVTPGTAALSTQPAPLPSSTDAPTKPDYHVHAGPMTMALTFDDGPSPGYTAEVLALLRQYRVTATFFMIGRNVQAFPELARQVAEAGHRVGNHTWSHPDLGKLSPAQVRTEIERTNTVITQVVGQRPVLFRAPGGFFTRASMAVCGDLGLRPVSWSVDPEDWANPGADVITDRVLRHARTGSIVLDHDGCLVDGAPVVPGSPADRSQTVAAVRAYLPRLVGAGYRFTVPGPP